MDAGSTCNEVPRAEIKGLIKEAVRKYWDEAKALSDELWAHPELSGKEFESSKKIAALLKKHGFEVEYPYLGDPTSFRGTLDNGEGPKIAIMVVLYVLIDDLGTYIVIRLSPLNTSSPSSGGFSPRIRQSNAVQSVKAPFARVFTWGRYTTERALHDLKVSLPIVSARGR